MPAQAYIYCTGAVHAFASIPNTFGPNPSFATPFYLGTCEQMPQPQDEYQYEPAMNDIGGRKKGLDETYQGMLSAISLDLTRWSEANLLILKSTPFYTRADGQGNTLEGGITSRMAIGSLTIQQGNYYHLWLVNDFWLAPQGGGPSDLPPGRFYWACKTLARYEPVSGTAAAKQRLEIGAFSTYQPVATSGVPARGFFDWSEDPTYFNATTFNSLIT